MLAGVLHATNDLRYEEIATPVPEKNQVLVKVKYTGICGSDIPRVNGTACHFFPMILGHEFSGTVHAVGEGVTTVKEGQRVAGIPLVPCMECEDCQKGNYSLCKHYSFIGSRQFGSFAEYVLVPETNVFPFSDDVSFQQGAFFEPSTVALHALKVANYKAGCSTAIIGSGNIGLLTLQWAKIMGATNLTAINRSREKLQIAKELGAEHTISTLDSDYYDQIMALTKGRGFDFVFDATGNEKIMKEALNIVGNKGTVCMIGTPKDTISFTVKEWENINRKECILTGSWMSYSVAFPGEEWEKTAHYFATGALQIHDKMLDQIIPLSKIANAFELFKKPGLVNGKILIDSEK